MSYHKFSYLSSTRRAATQLAVTTPSPPRSSCEGSRHPVRVTPSALPLLIYAILYSIEFLAPAGPHVLPSRRSAHDTDSRHGCSHCTRRSGGKKGMSHTHVTTTTTTRDDDDDDNNTATAVPSAMSTLPAHVLSVVANLFGRTPRSESSSRTHVVGSASSSCVAPMQHGTACVKSSSSSGSSSRRVSDDGAFVERATTQSPNVTSFCGDTSMTTSIDDVDAVVLSRMYEQAHVVPVTQIIHKLGGVYLVVREQHLPSVEAAKTRVLHDVQNIVEHADMRRSMHRHSTQRDDAAQTVGVHRTPLSTPSTTATEALTSVSSASSGDTSGGVSRGVGNHTAPAAAAAAALRRAILTSPRRRATGQSGQSCRHDEGSRGDVSGSSAARSSSVAAYMTPHRLATPLAHMTELDVGITTTSTTTTTTTTTTTSSALTASSADDAMRERQRSGQHDCADVVHTLAGDVGLELTVRLLTRATRWRVSYDERPLAEWCFAIVRTANEETVCCCQDPRRGGDCSTYNNGCGGGRHALFANDANQIEDVLHFIRKTFYEAISMETFADYTAGELVFDARVAERRSFCD